MARTASKSSRKYSKKSVEDKKAEVAALLTKAEEGVKSLKTSEGWKRWLSFQKSFHAYSLRNTMLIMCQYPEATQVTGFNTWKKHGRFVKKGEKSIRILAPSFRKVEKEDKSGEKKEEKILAYFRTVGVFDVTQTEGEELPSPVQTLDCDVDPELFNRLVKASVVPVNREECSRGNGYYCSNERKIAVDSRLSPAQAIKTLVHEMAHSMLHADRDKQGLSRADAELEAESVAFIVCGAHGLDTSSYSFGYVTAWKGDNTAKTLKESAERICSCAKKILEAVPADTTE